MPVLLKRTIRTCNKRPRLALPTHNGSLSHATAIVVAVSSVAYLSANATSDSTQKIPLELSMRFLHVSSFAILIGVQFWMQIAGLTLYATLTRKVFANIQTKLFPLYFITGIVTCNLSLFSHIYIHRTEDSWKKDSLLIYQTIGLVVCLMGFLVNFLYTGPETVRLSLLRVKNISSLGIEDGIGRLNSDLVKHDAKFQAVNTQFLRMHHTCSLVNLLCYTACGVSAWCLVNRDYASC